MATVNFLYRSTKERANLHLRLLYRYDDKDFVFGANTQFLTTSDYWKKKHKKKSKDILITNKQIEVNKELNKIENHILSAFNSADKDSVDKEWLKAQINNYYNPVINEEIPTNLVKYIEFYIEYRKSDDPKKTSIQKWEVIKGKIEEMELVNEKTYAVKDVNENFKRDFVNFYKSMGYAQNTINKEFGFVKTFCKHARRKGVETDPELDDLKIKKGATEKIYLTFEELSKIKKVKKEMLSPVLESARDWLIISCYTAQRISDFMRFNEEMIRTEEGVKLIEFTQKKTGKLMTIPLLPEVLKILKKRNGFPPSMPDQKYNARIKRLCELAKLTYKIRGSMQVKTINGTFRRKEGMFRKCDLISSHVGRRSFATNHYGLIATTYLMNFTGHSTEAMFLEYIGKSNKDLALETAKQFENLNIS